MKDNDGFTIRCKHSQWREINERGDDECVCLKYQRVGYHVCYADEYCRDYEPIKEKTDVIQQV